MNRKLFLLFFFFMCSVGYAMAERYIIPPNFSIFSDSNYSSTIGNTGVDSLEITPKSRVDGFLTFDYNGTTGYIKEIYVIYEGDSIDASLYDSFSGAVWKKTITFNNKNTYTIYFGEKGQPVAAFHKEGAINSVILFNDEGQSYASVGVDEKGNIKQKHGAVQIYTEPTKAGIPVALKGATMANGSQDSHGHPTKFKLSTGNRIATVEYAYRSNGDIDNYVYEQIEAYKVLVTEVDKENNDVVKNTFSVVGLAVYGLITILLFVYMIVYVFRYNTIRNLWNKIARTDFAPQKRLNGLLARGIVPVIFLFLPLALLYKSDELAIYSSGRQIGEAIMYLLVGFLLMFVWIWVDAHVFNPSRTVRETVCRNLYGAITLGAVIMLIFILLYIAVFVLVLLFLCGMLFGAGGASGALGGVAETSGGGSPYTCSSCGNEVACNARGILVGTNPNSHSCGNYTPRP